MLKALAEAKNLLQEGSIEPWNSFPYTADEVKLGWPDRWVWTREQKSAWAAFLKATGLTKKAWGNEDVEVYASKGGEGRTFPFAVVITKNRAPVLRGQKGVAPTSPGAISVIKAAADALAGSAT